MKKIYENDKSGNKKKFSYMIENYPNFTNEIIDFSKKNNLYGLPFDELSYLYYNNLENVPSDEFGYKSFKGWSKGYSKRGKFKKLEEKFIESNLENFKDNISNEDFEKQKKGGFLTQKISNNYIFYEQINKKYLDAIYWRQKVNMFINGLEEVPSCKVCKNKTIPRKTHGEFRETCSEVCRRILEGSYKSYEIKYNEEIIKVQGYERYVLPELLKKYDRKNLKIGFENKGILYKFEGKNRLYIPDVYIISENKIIEVKSTYTFKLDKKKNLAKREQCIKEGYYFDFYIWDKGKIIIK
jgi:hypothetical protein